MNILGITGLGVDPAACIVRDGKLVAMVQEERLNRIKGSYGLLPERASAFCLRSAGLCLDDIDSIAFSWDARKYRLYIPWFFFTTYITRAPKFQGDSIVPKLREILKYQPGNVKEALTVMLRKAGLRGKIPPVEFIPHHLAHAASAYYCSGFDHAHILVLDGSGEDQSTTVFRGEGTDIREKAAVRIPDSLGWFYQSVTEFLGFLPNRDECKVMALAPFGKFNEEIYSKFRKMITHDSAGGYRYDAGYSFLGRHSHGAVYSDAMAALLGPGRHRGEPLTQEHKDIAFAAQNILEEIVLSIVRKVSAMEGYNGALCLAGGVALNCKLAGKVAEKVDRLFISPASNDAGSALGAALHLSKEKGFAPSFIMESPYWGPEFSGQEIRDTLQRLKVKFSEEKEIAAAAAALLAKNKVVGWFQGRMEIGPRALGARSILANPADVRMRDTINGIKNRELWQPLAPSLLSEAAPDYLLKVTESPFMAVACGVTRQAREKLAAVVHVDGSTRPHTVKETVNGSYWRLLKEIGKLTGVPAVLNTSFNARGEPVVCSPEQALRTFFTTGIDYLAIGDFLVSK